MKPTSALLLGALLTAAAFAQKPEPVLISTETLARQLTDPNLVLLHVGRTEEYLLGHIAGARYIGLHDITVPPVAGALLLELPPIDQLRNKIAAFGISDKSRIVVYGGFDIPFQTTTRIVFTLQYLGLGDRTSILDGGLDAWKRQNRALTRTLPEPRLGTLTTRPPQNIVADAALIQSLGKRPSYKLVDARAPGYFKGTESGQLKNGHIPGAINIPYTEMVDANGMVNEPQIRKVFKEAGIKPGDTVVTYCHIGQQATAVMLGARLLGNPVMLYDGSFQDWAANNRGPVEK